MKRVLYISNTKVPYRVRFFNELAKHCDLTVLYERKSSGNRDSDWAASEKSCFKISYLGGINVGDEFSFSLKIFKYIFSGYDVIVIGCFNSPVQMLALLVLRTCKIRYALSFDGEIFIRENTLKSKLKKFFLKDADIYLAAGEKSAESVKNLTKTSSVYPYFFSSLSNDELIKNSNRSKQTIRNKRVLVIGQYEHYKGLDIAVKMARMDDTIHYLFVGMGRKLEEFIEQQQLSGMPNIEVIPFLKKDLLEQEYMRDAVLLLPSRQECWGLVINEAASFGMPIVSTYGSGAAVEFLSDSGIDSLAVPNDPVDLYKKLRNVMNIDNSSYTDYLIKKSQNYSIQKMVLMHIEALGL